MKRIGTLFLAIFLAAAAHAHGDEDHGSPASGAAPPVAARAAAARAGTATDSLELVALLEGERLTLFLDDFATNAPVVDAQVELASGATMRAAVQVAPGTYALDAGDLATPGSHSLAVSVETGEMSDLLAVQLEVAAPAAPLARAANGTGVPLAWAGAGVLLLAGGAIALRRRKSGGEEHAR
ncbi:MAG: hypothetical protein J0H00_05800 [Burkholderiales bacterium]|nr:hypothetical protein [Burkholderiales bacterium]OJX04734.1 MAG: hypothetical protein BGO72_13240 [Burkholderiales bacterium 70-64]